MDASHGPLPPKPALEAAHTAQAPASTAEGAAPGESEDPVQPASRPVEVQQGAPQESFSFAGLLKRATGALSAQSPDDDGEDGDALGSAFAGSTASERAMVLNILRLRELRVEDVMTPRADIVAVAEDASLETVTVALQRGSLSRLPVYRETLDDPIGFVHLKDLALYYGVGCPSEDTPDFALANHLRPALYVPPSMRIVSLLRKMQGARVHMALVIDEFGGVDGLVTIEDLVEQIVGDIEDEHDSEDPAQWVEEAPGVYVLDARTDIRAFEAAEGVHLLPEDWEEDVDTMGGLVFMLTGRVPARGEVISHPMQHEFEIADADPRKIRRIRLSVAGKPATDPESAPA
ncbi:MAG: hemolysin family protein [Pseudomonadota bacterium]